MDEIFSMYCILNLLLIAQACTENASPCSQWRSEYLWRCRKRLTISCMSLFDFDENNATHHALFNYPSTGAIFRYLIALCVETIPIPCCTCTPINARLNLAKDELCIL